MSDHDAKVVAELRRLQDGLLSGRTTTLSAKTIYDSLALIERLAADVARKDAEIERLTLRWSSEPPKVEGFYRWRWMTESGWKENHRPIRVEEADLLSGGWLVDFGHQYAGPIATPLEKAGEESIEPDKSKILLQRPDYRNDGKYQFITGYTGGFGGVACVHLDAKEISRRCEAANGTGILLDDGVDLWWQKSPTDTDKEPTT